LTVLFKGTVADVKHERAADDLNGVLLLLVNAETADERVDARCELRGGKGLGDVVVRAGHKPGDLVDLLTFCREHDDAHLGAGRADAAADLKPVDIGQHDIQQGKADVGVLLELFKSHFSVLGLYRLEAAAAQVDDHKAADICFVFQNKYLLHICDFPLLRHFVSIIYYDK